MPDAPKSPVSVGLRLLLSSKLRMEETVPLVIPRPTHFEMLLVVSETVGAKDGGRAAGRGGGEKRRGRVQNYS